jgi:REP element-mobilizing transposase RayT
VTCWLINFTRLVAGITDREGILARPLRQELALALHHITSRGDLREAIYEDDVDRQMFLSLLDRIYETRNGLCHAYCLMGKHHHLLIETPDANRSHGMQQLNGMYTQKFNRLHNRVGKVDVCLSTSLRGKWVSVYRIEELQFDHLTVPLQRSGLPNHQEQLAAW